MPTIDEIARFLEEFAPPAAAEDWDNVGLLVGDRIRPAARVMTCLTITGASAAEAIGRRADLIVAHHPLPLRPLRQLTTDSREGRLLWQLIGAGIAIYSPHTAFDSAAAGINTRLAEQLGLAGIAPLVPRPDGPGAGRYGMLTDDVALAALARQVKRLLNVPRVQVVGDLACTIRTIGVACGSGGEFIPAAAAHGCQALLTGEARFHACLEAESRGLALILAGHYATERFAVEQLADVLATRFGDVEVWPSRDKRDPIAFL
jgi:dinuclear metal center YbgI/SA1388 family protein